MSTAPEQPTDRWTRPALASALVVTLGLGVAHALSYLPAFADDAFISFRYAERLYLGEGLTWTDGERVEGYSNLLWVLIMTGARALTADMATASRVLGVLATVAAMVAVFAGSRPFRRPADVLAPAAGALLIALSGPTAAWAVGGLEAPLQLGLLLWAMVALYPIVDRGFDGWKGLVRPGALLALCALTRADGALFTALACAGLVLARGLSWQNILGALRLACLPLAAVAGQLAFRLAYYHEWVPNTYYAKVAWTTARLKSGWTYVSKGGWLLEPPSWILVLAPVVAAIDRDARRRLVFLAVPAFGWLAYVIVIGGDNMAQRRHLVQFIGLTALLLCELLRAAWKRGPRARWVGHGLAAAGLVGLAARQPGDPERERATTHLWVWKCASVGDFLGRAFADQRPLVAINSAGALPFFAKLPALDMLGLNDRELTRRRPKNFGKGWVGHELGDADYVWKRRPDIIVFRQHTSALPPVWPAAKKLRGRRDFEQVYSLACFTTPDAIETKLFMRREGGRVGIQRSDDRVAIPGYFLAPRRGCAGELDPDGRVAARLKGEATLAPIEVPAGTWSLERDASSPDLIVEAHVDGGPAIDLAAGARLELAKDASVALTVRPARRGAAIHVHALTLVRVQAP